MRHPNFSKLLLTAAVLVPLAACEMYEPTNINDTRIQVAEKTVNHDLAAQDFGADSLSAIAQDYTERGGSPLELVVTYDPKSYRNTAMAAGDRASKFSRALRAQGVEQVNSRIIPVKDQGDESRVMLSYNAVTALAPSGCRDMPGMNGADSLGPDAEYRLGCGVDSLIAKQVARPGDLLGRGVSDPNTDGRGAANVIEAYRTGVRNEKLDGEKASDD